MQQFNISLGLFVFIFVSTLNSCAQNNGQVKAVSTKYVGSTPCDSIIRAQLGILPEAKCEFIKWDLTLEPAESDSFTMTINYGESKPNTNGFKKTEQILAKGKYGFTFGTNENPKAKILNLNAPELKSTILLLVLDSNILHFTDQSKQFLVGNGGFGYVLNKITISK